MAHQEQKNGNHNRHDGGAIVLPDGRMHTLREKLNSHETLDTSAEKESRPEPEPLEFRAFPDGTLVDLVRDAAAPKKPSLLISKAGTITFQQEFRYGGKVFVPRQVEPTLFAAIRLPSGIVPSRSAREIFGELQDCFSTYVDVAQDQQHLLVAFLMSTWFQDVLPVAPYLWVTGPYGSGKTTLLRIMERVCRRAVMVGDVTAAALYMLPSALVPTLIIDEFEMGRAARNRDMQHFLRMGSTRGGRAVRNSKIYETFCAKIISSRELPQDAALASRAVFVSMLPTSKPLSPLSESTLDRIAEKFQPLLLGYRLENYQQVTDGTPASVPDFTARMKGLARSLAAPLLGDEQCESQLLKVLAIQDHEAKLDRYAEPEWAVLTALYKKSHATGALTMSDLSFTVNDVLAENGESCALSPRRVGEIVRSLGLSTEQLGNRGRGLRLTRITVRRIHALARQLGLKRSDILDYLTVDGGYGGPPCSVCEELGLMVREDGVHLKCVNLFPRPRKGLYD
jgi:hypothetical protein